MHVEVQLPHGAKGEFPYVGGTPSSVKASVHKKNAAVVPEKIGEHRKTVRLPSAPSRE